MGLVRANGEDNEMSAPMAELRAAQAGDVGAVVAIDPHGPGRPSEIEALVREQASLVAVEHGEILGFLAIRPGHFYQRDFIDLLLVAPRSRRQGIGRALMRAALQNASTPRMFVSTNQSNMPMRELLRSEGWSASGVLTGLDENDPEHVFFHDAPAGQPASGHERAW
jgi:GNAT superfamily N-acetyltransferase